METDFFMDIGVSSACFFPYDTIESLGICAREGFRSVEIFANTQKSSMSGIMVIPFSLASKIFSKYS